MKRQTLIDSRLGVLTLVADGDALTGLYFPGHRHRPERAAFGRAVVAQHDPLFAEAARQLRDYLDGARSEFDLPIRTDGDPFDQRVWQLLRDIPYGTTTSYGKLAAELGDARQARRVGQAVGRNPLSVVIPCHRVVGADGRLTGYAGGLHRKAFLLELEAPAAVGAGRLF
ncbi:methylated-DNA--[protein]-cysteine S-methyltransferase [Nakamurella lactea]|uniref:methylated-DNA--[protein]-cysteine S-methyltransferase n=1 Tax=Nakamurella lactea TaxID=459515 RepID=UPI0004286ABF|nr:methylated-DNA--[protein]-cysteine S-methyltransferase [Nakamurella lactea]